MDGQQFDALVRSLSHSRRTLLGLGATLGLAPLAADARKRKKKKCKGNTKKCGKRCIPKTGCCSGTNCGPTSVCVNNQCQCAPGLRACNGTCIPQAQCCSNTDCGGDLVCISGTCACPQNAPIECPDQVCVSGEECCSSSECTGQQDTCLDGYCLCPENAINCDRLCCDAEDETCAIQLVDDSGPEPVYEASCQAGECPATDYCISDDIYLCQNDLSGVCFCTSTTDQASQNACIAIDPDLGLSCDDSCATSVDCPDGQVCIHDGSYCACGHNICVPLCENGTTRSMPTRRATGMSGEKFARRRISR